MAFEDIREYFTRHFLGRIEIHGGARLGMEAPVVMSLRRHVETHPIRAQMRIMSSEILSLKGELSCTNGGFRFAKELVRAKGEAVRRWVPKEMAVGSAPLVRRALGTRGDLKRALVLPQERTDRLQWQTRRPKLLPGEMLLAWYGPIVEPAVVKMGVDRRRGKLLIWYNPQSRRSQARGVYLCRRLGVKETEWRWD